MGRVTCRERPMTGIRQVVEGQDKVFEFNRFQPGVREEASELVLVATGPEPVERMDNDSSSMYRKGELEGGMDG